MNPLIEVYNTILYEPLLNALVLLYELIPGHDFGVAVILLTILIRVVFYPLTMQSLKSQVALSSLQPKIQEVQEKYKDDREKQMKELLSLYKKEKTNPLSGFLFLLIQLPILIALYQVFWKGFQPESLNSLYSFVSYSNPIDPYFLGIINLSQPSWILALLAGVFQFLQSKTLPGQKQKEGDAKKQKDQISQFSEMFQKQILYFFPLVTFFILLRLPAAIGLYWIVATLFSIGQQRLVKSYVKST